MTIGKQNLLERQTDPQYPEATSGTPKFLLLGVVILVFLGGVGGVFVGKNLYSRQPQDSDVESLPTPQDSQKEIVDSLSNWKTYVGQGVSFQYPVDLNLQTVDNAIILGRNGSFASYGFEVSDNLQKLVIRSWIQKNEQCGFSQKPSGDDIVTDGVNGVRIQETMTCPPGGGGKIDTVYLIKGNSVYQWYLIASGGAVTPEEKNVFDQMLKTIQWPPQSSIKPDRLSFKPPSGWIEIKPSDPNVKFNFYLPANWSYQFPCGGKGCGVDSQSKDYKESLEGSLVLPQSGARLSINTWDNFKLYPRMDISSVPYTENPSEAVEGQLGKVLSKTSFQTANFGDVYEYVVMVPGGNQPSYEIITVWAEKNDTAYVFTLWYNSSDPKLPEFKEILKNVVKSVS